MEKYATGNNFGGKVVVGKVTTPTPMGRVITPALETIPEMSCICNRPSTQVVCKICFYINKKGRVFRPCPTHPRTLYLSDMKQCPTCHSKDLIEMM